MSPYSRNSYGSPQESYEDDGYYANPYHEQNEDDAYYGGPYYEQNEDDSRATVVVENFKGAHGFVIDGGDFSTVAGNVYHGPNATIPRPRPRPPTASSRTSYFENTSNFTIRDGKFMTVGGDIYDPTPTPSSSHGMPQGRAVPNSRPYI